MNWRRRHPAEIDHELLWLAISSLSFIGAVLWLKLGLPWPDCLFHEVTHHACLTCGATRCLLALCHGHGVAAFWWNPLVFCALIGIFLFDLYALTVLLFNLPRLRFEQVPGAIAGRIRILAVLAAGANWIYLLHAGI